MRTFNLRTLKSLVLFVYACEFPTVELVNLVNFWVKLVKLGWIDLLLVKKLHSQKRSFQSLRANYIHLNKLTFIFLFKYYWAVFCMKKWIRITKQKLSEDSDYSCTYESERDWGDFQSPSLTKKFAASGCENGFLPLPSLSLLHLQRRLHGRLHDKVETRGGLPLGLVLT